MSEDQMKELILQMRVQNRLLFHIIRIQYISSKKTKRLAQLSQKDFDDLKDIWELVADT